MSKGNGQPDDRKMKNGRAHSVESVGGQGATALPTSDGHHDREDVRMLVRAIVGGWLKGRRLEAAIETLEEMARNNTDARARIHAANGLVRVAELGLKVAEFEDKCNRLDNDRPTEIVYDVQMPAPKEVVIDRD